MKKVLIDDLLIRSGIEVNPGPQESKDRNKGKSDLKIRTYNCNGLGDINKFRRLLTKIRNEVRNGGIVLLQETHIKDEDIIGRYWNMNYISSCISTQSAGVLTLYDNSYKCLESYKDNGGR
jgi:exonuclease III